VIETPLQRRTPLPPQLARRVGVLGVVAFVLFGIIAFRLWYLQVLTGPQNAALATANVVQNIPLPPPRGNILDAHGNLLATYRDAPEVAIVADNLPPRGARRWQEYERLARVLGLRAQAIKNTVDNYRVAPPGYAPTHVAYLNTHQLAYLAERQRYYPGVVERVVPVRYYPQGDIGSVFLGQVGQITGASPGSPGELGQPEFKGVTAGSIVGQSGLEAQYQPYLQGTPGVEKVQIDASGLPTGATPKVTPATAGDQLVTSIDMGLEREGYAAVRHAMASARANHLPATAAGFVAMDPMSGRILALGSVPSYNANEFATGISSSQLHAIEADKSWIDRAVDGAYPTGSTFKPITALAALKAGLITTQTSQGAGVCYTVGSGAAAQHFCNSSQANYGDLRLVNALAVSEDTFFYPIGAQAFGLAGGGEAIQDEARELGLGRSPGIDLPGGGYAGIVPDRSYVAAVNAQYWQQYCEGPVGVRGASPKPAYRNDPLAITGCTTQGEFEYWTEGQNVQLVTGQGFLEATPLQMAVAYSAIVNGGTVFSPRIATEILSPSGAVVQQLPPPLAHHVYIDPAARAAVMEGLHDAAQSPQGTSYPTFGSFPRVVYGKTGTAQHANQADQSWYVAYAPDPRRPIVVAVTIEQGGFGAAAAAPAARLMLSEWFGINKQFLAGSSRDR
jgi:penicillin-binding protein 2